MKATRFLTLALALLIAAPAVTQEVDLTADELPGNVLDMTVTVTGDYEIIGEIVTFAPSFSRDFNSGHHSAAVSGRVKVARFHLQGGVAYAQDLVDPEGDQTEWGFSPIVSARVRLLGPVGAVGYLRDPLDARYWGMGLSLGL